MSQMTLEVAFSAVDSLYFRGSRPHAAAGASALASEFPPPPSTFSGTLRTRLGDALGLDWSALKEGVYTQSGPVLDGVDLKRLMGSADDTGLLEFGAPVLRKAGQRLFPVPAVVLKNDQGLLRMLVGDAVETDLGYVHLPMLPEGVQNAKPLDDCWLTEKGMQQFLKGEVPGADQLVEKGQVVQYESRLGIGRDARLGTVMSGLLYQTEHVRLAPDVDLVIRVTLPAPAANVLLESITEQPLQRFGGEGRMAELRASVVDETPPLPPAASNTELLMLLTDMLPEHNFSEAPLPGFTPTTLDGVKCWQGEIAGVSLYLLCVASGKPRRFGGWDIRHNRPRPVQSYIPAGSCFYVRPVNPGEDLKPIHGKQIGRRTDFGFGTLVCAA